MPASEISSTAEPESSVNADTAPVDTPLSPPPPYTSQEFRVSVATHPVETVRLADALTSEQERKMQAARERRRRVEAALKAAREERDVLKPLVAKALKQADKRTRAQYKANLKELKNNNDTK